RLSKPATPRPQPIVAPSYFHETYSPVANETRRLTAVPLPAPPPAPHLRHIHPQTRRRKIFETTQELVHDPLPRQLPAQKPGPNKNTPPPHRRYRHVQKVWRRALYLRLPSSHG